MHMNIDIVDFVLIIKGSFCSSQELRHFQMDRLHNGQNFDKFRNSKIHYHSIKKHVKLSRIVKFGCEML